MPAKYSLTFYDEHPKSCDRADFWGQVRRTVDGLPVGDDQIDMIVQAVTDGLELAGDDRLIDLCCGNGALTDRFLAGCGTGVGVDASAVLVSIAREYFERRPDRTYVLADVLDHVRSDPDAASFTKAVCYGSFSYLQHEKAETLLRTLSRRFPGILRLFLGNLPDKTRLHTFYREREYRPGIEDDPGSAIGIWRTPDELADLAQRTGWTAGFRRMPDEYYAAGYRYDCVLTPCR